MMTTREKYDIEKKLMREILTEKKFTWHKFWNVLKLSAIAESN